MTHSLLSGIYRLHVLEVQLEVKILCKICVIWYEFSCLCVYLARVANFKFVLRIDHCCNPTSCKSCVQRKQKGDQSNLRGKERFFLTWR